MIPVLFHIGPFAVQSFGVMMALGFLFGSHFAAREYGRRGHDPAELRDFTLWVFVAGVVSSRVLSIFNDVPGFLADPMVALSGSGFVWYGGFLGGTAAAFGIARWRNLSFAVIAECCAIGLALGQALGRVGCHVAGDGDWGTVTDLPWGVAYVNAVHGWGYPEGVRVHPTPLYEMSAYLGVFLLLLALARRKPAAPTLFATYLVGTSVSRFVVEFWRINPVVGAGLTQAQLVAIVLFVVGATLLARLRLRPAMATTAACLVLLVAGCEGRGVGQGDLAPDFLLPRVDGAVRKLSAYRGRPVLLNLWATWCPPCLEEMPLLEGIARDYEERGLVVLGVAGDDDRARVEEYLSSHPVGFEVLLDADGAVGTRYGITGYPETFLIDREGRIRGKVVGPIPSEGGRAARDFTDRVEALFGA